MDPNRILTKYLNKENISLNKHL